MDPADTPRSGAARIMSEVSRRLPKVALMPPIIGFRCGFGGDPTAQALGTRQHHSQLTHMLWGRAEKQDTTVRMLRCLMTEPQGSPEN